MAGSYFHVIDEKGWLLEPEEMQGMIENLGDAYEAIEEMYWMIQVLAKDDGDRIIGAQKRAIKRIADSRRGW